MYMVGMGTFRDWSETQYQIYLHRSQYADYNPQQYRPIAWPMSLFLFGAIIGSIFFGFITMKFGRKIPLLSVSVPLIVSKLMFHAKKDANKIHEKNFFLEKFH